MSEMSINVYSLAEGWNDANKVSKVQVENVVSQLMPLFKWLGYNGVQINTYDIIYTVCVKGTVTAAIHNDGCVYLSTTATDGRKLPISQLAALFTLATGNRI